MVSNEVQRDQSGLEEFLRYANNLRGGGEAIGGAELTDGINQYMIAQGPWEMRDISTPDNNNLLSNGMEIVSLHDKPVWAGHYQWKILDPARTLDVLSLYEQVQTQPHPELPVCGQQGLEAKGLRYFFREQKAAERVDSRGRLSVDEYAVDEHMVDIETGKRIYRSHLMGGWIIKNGRS